MGLSLPVQIVIAAGIGALGTLAVTQNHTQLSDAWSFFAPVIGSRADTGGAQATAGRAHDGCLIKGNISINTGKRIYHVPGQMFYDATVISPQYGERWFCSEAEARAAGWRRARR